MIEEVIEELIVEMIEEENRAFRVLASRHNVVFADAA